MFMKISMTTIMFMSSLICMMLNSWLMIWIMLEMNTLSFCFLVKTESKQKETMTETSMKYFIIQSLSSALLISSGIIGKTWSNSELNLSNLTVIALMIKMASSPFHKWFVNMVQKMSLKNNSLLMTWQKLAPVYLIIFQMKMVVLPFMFLSAMMGSFMQMNKSKMTEIMAYSSVFNLSWMLMSIIMSLKTMIMYSILYWSSVITVMALLFISEFNMINLENTNQYNKYTYLASGINLGGIPPSLGFISKVMVLTEMLKIKMVMISTLLLMISSINMYIYMRMFNFVMMKKAGKNQMLNKLNKKAEKMFMIIMILPIITTCL